MIDFLDLVTFMCTLYKLMVQEYELLPLNGKILMEIVQILMNFTDF